MRNIPQLRRPRHSRAGVAMVYCVVMMVIFLGFASFAVDFGRVQMAKTQLFRAADAAARAAVSQLGNGATATQNAAVNLGVKNACDGIPVVIDPINDVDFGTWNPAARTFTVLTGSSRSGANAVRVWARRTTSRGNAVPLMFAQVIGSSSCDVNASSIACLIGSIPASMTGYNAIILENNLWVASYDSSLSTAPTHATSGSAAVMQSNGAVSGWNSNDVLFGNLNLGPLGTNTSVNVSGTTTVRPSPVPAPTMPGFTAVTNPGGVSSTPIVNANVTWPGGTYYFTSFNIALAKTVTFSGPATVYMNGNLTGTDNNAFISSKDRRINNCLDHSGLAT